MTEESKPTYYQLHRLQRLEYQRNYNKRQHDLVARKKVYFARYYAKNRERINEKCRLRRYEQLLQPRKVKVVPPTPIAPPIAPPTPTPQRCNIEIPVRNRLIIKQTRESPSLTINFD